MIPIARPLIGEEEVEEVRRVMLSGYLTHGPEVEAFEEEFADFLGGRVKTAAVSSGTAALHLSFLALGLGRGKRFLTTPFTFMATVAPGVQIGADVLFADIDPESFNLSIESLKEVLEREEVDVVVPVDLYGQPTQLDEVERLARKYGFRIVEDSCQAHGALWKDRPAGTFGDLGVFSFYPTKNMTTGEGGMVVSRDEELLVRVQTLRNQGQTGRYTYETLGYNFRMTSIAAAIGRVQLKKLKTFNSLRRRRAEILRDLLEGVDGVEVPIEVKGAYHVYHQFTIRVKGGRRDALAEHLKRKGVGYGIYYPKLLYDYEPLRRFRPREDLPEARRATEEVLSLPVHPGVREKDIYTIADAVKDFFKQQRG
ncbi:MAG: DegT/DnrJ/EryC1/StrS family aminotransferase [Thermoplasmata archaeon]|nr:DegT/DnrJ/EryC1/StrS family aminotransferase [Thermoplasmata archaeon]